MESNEYGIACVYFDLAVSMTYEVLKTDLSLEKAAMNNTFFLTSQAYSEPLKYTIQIINKDCSPISPEQERALNKWLCKRGEFKPFFIINKRYSDVCFFVNFSNPKIIWINNVNGIEYTVTTNAPYAFSGERSFTADFNGNNVVSRYIDNDEELEIYPSMEITIQESGDFTLTNLSAVGAMNQFSVKNCVQGEIITVDSKYPLLSSSIASHFVYNDFNTHWFYFVDAENNITTNLQCNIRFNYREYRRMGIL